MEIEENNKFPFLDVLISRKEDSSISHQVYRKKTHTDRYLHADSHHFPPQKIGVINTLVTRALRISDREHIKDEINHLERVFEDNGYSGKQFRKVVASVIKPRGCKTKDNDKDTNISKVSLPYIKGTTDKLAKTLKRHKIQVVFKPPNTIRNLVDSLKDPVEPKAYKGVYCIPCSCNQLYIGETGRSMETRLKEHSADLRHNRYKKSAIAEHAFMTGHHICLENAKVIAREDNLVKRKIREKIEINLNENCLNRDDGAKISDSWKPLLHSLHTKENQLY